MRVGLITNWNGKGLTVDGNLLSAFLAELGHEPVAVQFDVPCAEKFDLTISLEVVNDAFFSLAPKHVWIPNLEWTKDFYLRHVRKFDRIWSKTLDADAALRERFAQVTYTGFLSRDRMDVSVGRERKFLHVGGDSGLKNTNAVIAAWRQWRYWAGELDAPLTVVSRAMHTDVVDTPGVTFIREATDEELRVIQNSHLFHLQPSAYEGWGHAIRESQSVGAVLLTTRAGPMSELKAPFEIDPTGSRKVCMATAWNVSGREIREKVGVMLEQPSQMVAKYQIDARLAWVGDHVRARERLAEALKPFSRPVAQVSIPKSPTAHIATSRKVPVLAMLGNFRPEFSTENDLLWTLNDMGYEVRSFQEDTDSTESILRECEDAGVELLIYVHTHGWSTPGMLSLDELWKRLERKGVKTCSFHLDRYWGLNALDRREDNIGKHAFWHTNCVFSADGGNQAGFKSRGVNHVWLPPGSSKRWSFDGDFRPEFAVNVGFVGARGYHDQEYPFRGQLISFLEETYGNSFRLFQGVRGVQLNDLYKSVKVLVGDSCFANQDGGIDAYISDRVPETLNRGGLLLHPAVERINWPGLVTYSPGNLGDLTDKIDWFLSNPEERVAATKVGSAWARANETYHNRMTYLLGVMGI